MIHVPNVKKCGKSKQVSLFAFWDMVARKNLKDYQCYGQWPPLLKSKATRKNKIPAQKIQTKQNKKIPLLVMCDQASKLKI